MTKECHGGAGGCTSNFEKYCRDCSNELIAETGVLSKDPYSRPLDHNDGVQALAYTVIHMTRLLENQEWIWLIIRLFHS